MKKIKNSKLSKKTFNNFYLFTDACFNHEGNFEYLLELIELSAQGNSDGIKFQILLDIDEYYTADSTKIPSKYLFSEQQWKEAVDFAIKNSLEVIITPLDDKAVSFCKNNIELISAIEIHSINLNDYFLLEEIKYLNVTMILGIGGRTISEINYALEKLREHKKEVYLMYGFQSFPTDYYNLNLYKLEELRNKFGLSIGYADHTSYSDDYGKNVIEIAFSRGATIFELHITKTKGEKRIDFEAAYNTQDILDIRARLNKIIRILGNKKAHLHMNESEKRYRGREKQIVAKIQIQKNQIITLDSLTFKISSKMSDFSQSEIMNIVGKKAKNTINKDDVIKFEDVLT